MIGASRSSSASSFWRNVSSMLFIIMSFQWIIGTYYFIEDHHRHHGTDNSDNERRQHPYQKNLNLSPTHNDHYVDGGLNINLENGKRPSEMSRLGDGTGRHELVNNWHYDGVAVTLMLRAPKWFHRRYTAMLHNVISNLPSDPWKDDGSSRGWAVQVVVNRPWLEKDVFPLHPGLRRLLQPSSSLSSHTAEVMRNTSLAISARNGEVSSSETSFVATFGGHDIYVTELPSSMTKLKPKQIYKSKWFWESVLADHVLMFSGNGAFCANHDVPPSEPFSSSSSLLNKLALEDKWDYVGIPWSRYYGLGGDGSTHSLRRKSAMLRILSTYPKQAESQDTDSAYFVKHMLESVKNNEQQHQSSSASAPANHYPYKVADVETTKLFGGVSTTMDSSDNTKEIIDGNPPMIISGTMANLNWSARDNLLQICPELKMIFPSLHEPNCFGAHPNGEKCRATICALQDKIPGPGC